MIHVLFPLLRLVTRTRTFFMQAKSESEANEWVAMLKWKLVSRNCLTLPLADAYSFLKVTYECLCFY